LADDPSLAESGVERVADPAHEVRNGNQARAMAAERKIELPSHGRPTLSEQVAGHLYVALDELTGLWGCIAGITHAFDDRDSIAEPNFGWTVFVIVPVDQTFRPIPLEKLHCLGRYGNRVLLTFTAAVAFSAGGLVAARWQQS
jgi:hypothetical protein